MKEYGSRRLAGEKALQQKQVRRSAAEIRGSGAANVSASPAARTDSRLLQVITHTGRWRCACVRERI